MKTGWSSNLAFVKCTWGEVHWCVKIFFFLCHTAQWSYLTGLACLALEHLASAWNRTLSGQGTLITLKTICKLYIASYTNIDFMHVVQVNAHHNSLLENNLLA